MSSSLVSMEKVLELAFDHTISPIAILDKKYNFIRVNKAYAKTDNREVLDFPGLNHFDLYPSEYKPIFDEVIISKKPYQVYAKPFVYENNPERGVTYWDWTLVPILDDKDEVEFLILILKDVTVSERARIEIEKLLELSNDLICITDFELNFKRTNPAFLHILGYTKEDLLNKKISDLVHFTDNSKLTSAKEESLETGKPLSNLIVKLLCKNGEHKWINWSCVPEKGLCNFYCIGRNITEFKNAQDNLILMKERFLKVFNASPSLMIIYEFKTGEIIDVNESFLFTTGYGMHEVIGRTSLQLKLWVQTKQWVLIRSLLIKKGYVKNYEILFYTKSGEIHTGLYSAELLKINNKTHTLVSINDITEVRIVEKEMAKLDRLNLVGQMAAGIGHEIRNPMTTVRGFLQLLSAKKECDKQKEYFDLMIDELDRANTIITEFLSLAKYKPENLEKNNLNHIIKNITPLIEVEARRQDMFLLLDLDEVPDILLNEKEIRQLILNLVNNGFEAMFSGGKLTIKTSADLNEVVLSICDEGPGIDSEALEKVGTPFFTTKDKGTGLGVAVCHSIAKRNNAIIDINTSSQGTIFHVRFKKFRQ